MATIKIKFRTSSVKTKEGVLFYQIIHARVTRQINTGYKIFPSEWDKHLACIILPDNNDIRRRFLAQLTSRIAEDMHRLKNIISKLEHSGNPFTSGKIIELFRIPPINKYSFLSFAQDLIIQPQIRTKLFSVLLASKRPLITELADKLRLKYPLLPTISPCPLCDLRQYAVSYP